MGKTACAPPPEGNTYSLMGNIPCHKLHRLRQFPLGSKPTQGGTLLPACFKHSFVTRQKAGDRSTKLRCILILPAKRWPLRYTCDEDCTFRSIPKSRQDRWRYSVSREHHYSSLALVGNGLHDL